MVYQGPLSGGGVAEMTIRRFPAGSGVSPDEACSRALSPFTPLLVAILGGPPTKSQEKLGPWEGIELRPLGLPMVVRAAADSTGEVYLVALRVVGVPLQEELYRVFDSVCGSFEPVDRPE